MLISDYLLFDMIKSSGVNWSFWTNLLDFWPENVLLPVYFSNIRKILPDYVISSEIGSLHLVATWIWIKRLYTS